VAHIILVEDQQAQLNVLMILIKALCPPFTEILGVNNGQQALEAYEETRTDLIISDHEMPVMDGSKLTRTLRSRGATIPIIITSGNSFVSDQAYNAGATLFVEKTRLIKTLPKIMGYLLPEQPF
jgi:CheY-like chemotaxis protein